MNNKKLFFLSFFSIYFKQKSLYNIFLFSSLCIFLCLKTNSINGIDTWNFDPSSSNQFPLLRSISLWTFQQNDVLIKLGSNHLCQLIFFSFASTLVTDMVHGVNNFIQNEIKGSSESGGIFHCNYYALVNGVCIVCF